MRLTIMVDGAYHVIDSTDPDLLGKWMTEIMGRIVAHGIKPATYIQVQAFPSWIPDVAGGHPDWIADSRIIGSTWQVASPREIVAALAQQLDDAEAMTQ
jgi:hypothetical protein